MVESSSERKSLSGWLCIFLCDGRNTTTVFTVFFFMTRNARFYHPALLDVSRLHTVAADRAPRPHRAVACHSRLRAALSPPVRRRCRPTPFASTLPCRPVGEVALARQAAATAEPGVAEGQGSRLTVGLASRRPAHHHVRRARICPAPDAAHAAPELVDGAAAERPSVPPCALLAGTGCAASLTNAELRRVKNSNSEL
jgi:hypothetical protein